jgi:hypothetical protein
MIGGKSMMDLIDRQAALNEIAEWMLEYGALNEKRERDALQHVARGIKKLPSAQTQTERTPGRWIPQDNNKVNGMTSTTAYYYPKCSVCGHCANYTSFCQNCGADMRGEQNETD